MVGWHHRINGHEFELTPEIGVGQGSLAYCITWGRKESDTTERLDWTELIIIYYIRHCSKYSFYFILIILYIVNL